MDTRPLPPPAGGSAPDYSKNTVCHAVEAPATKPLATCTAQANAAAVAADAGAAPTAPPATNG